MRNTIFQYLWILMQYMREIKWILLLYLSYNTIHDYYKSTWKICIWYENDISSKLLLFTENSLSLYLLSVFTIKSKCLSTLYLHFMWDRPLVKWIMNRENNMKICKLLQFILFTQWNQPNYNNRMHFTIKFILLFAIVSVFSLYKTEFSVNQTIHTHTHSEK